MTALLTTTGLEGRLSAVDSVFCFDTETEMWTSASGGLQSVRLVQIADYQGNEVLLDTLEMSTADIQCLREFLERPEIEVIAQNMAFDYRVMLSCGIYIGGKPSISHLPKLRDTMLASQILYNGKANVRHNLAAIAKRELDVVLDKTLQKNDWMSATLTEEEVAYAMNDVRYTLKAHTVLMDKLNQQGLIPTYELECALIPSVVEMETTGMRLDPDAIGETLKHYEQEVAACRQVFLETLDGRLQAEGL